MAELAPPDYKGKTLTIPFAVEVGGVGLEYNYSLICPRCNHDHFGMSMDYVYIVCMDCKAILMRRIKGGESSWVLT